MYKVLVAKDDADDASSLCDLLRASSVGDLLLVKTIRQADEALDVSSSGNIDIALIDVNFGGKADGGIAFAQWLFSENERPQIIYLSDNDRHNASVYKTEHVSLLLNPVCESALTCALDKAVSNIRRSGRKRLAVRIGNAVKLVAPQDIEYIESKGRKAWIYLTSGELSTYAALSDMAFRLPDTFVRCHKSYLVNMGYVVELRSDGLLLKSGALIPVSQSRKKETRRQIRCFSHFPSVG